jgi:hypothetical protein
MRNLKFKIVILLILLFLSSLLSQELKYKVDKPSKLFIGTPFHLLVDITTQPSDSIFSPVMDTLDIFILKGEILQSEETENDLKTTKLDLTFQPFDVGEFTFPELEFAVKSADSLTFLKTSEFKINIQSVISDTTQTIKDIADPAKVNLGFWDYLFPILAIAIIVFLIWYLKRFFKKMPEEEEVPVFFDSRPAYIIALEVLKKLKKRKLLEKGDFLNFHFRLSYILRLFVELQFKINAVEMTTTEIRDSLKTDDFKEKNLILEFLKFSDKVKFAKFIPEMKDSQDAVNWLDAYLNEYKNKPADENLEGFKNLQGLGKVQGDNNA